MVPVTEMGSTRGIWYWGRGSRVSFGGVLSLGFLLDIQVVTVH